MLRRRLAAPAQQRTSSGGGHRTVIRPPGPPIRPGGRPARPASFREDVEEEDEEDDSENDEDLDSDYPRASRAVREAGRAQQQAALSPAEGLMLLPSDDTDRTLAPASLLPILAGLIQDERLPIRSQFLYRLLQNIAKSPRLRDIALRLLVSLLLENREAANSVVADLTDGEQAEFTFHTESDTEGYLDAEQIRTCSRRAYAVPKAPLKGVKILSQLSASRLVDVLFHLSSANVSVVYDMLSPRVGMGGRVIRLSDVTAGLKDSVEVEVEDECGSKKDVEKSTNESDTSPLNSAIPPPLQNNQTQTQPPIQEQAQTEVSAPAQAPAQVGEGEGEPLKGSVALPKKVMDVVARHDNNNDNNNDDNDENDDDEIPEGRSTESLLEMLMPLFAHPNFAGSSSDLSELTAFINVVSAPLEYLAATETDTDPPSKLVREETCFFLLVCWFRRACTLFDNAVCACVCVFVRACVVCVVVYFYL